VTAASVSVSWRWPPHGSRSQANANAADARETGRQFDGVRAAERAQWVLHDGSSDIEPAIEQALGLNSGKPRKSADAPDAG
jgi:hypothetical protein